MSNNTLEIIVTGIDEVGRGSLFGPVFAGVVVLNKKEEIILLNSGLKDSKLLNAKKRAILQPLIERNSTAWGIGQSSAKEIDFLGIRRATELAMIRAIQKLPRKPSLIYVDGLLPLSLWNGPQENFVKGEDKYPSIAAASVLAKEKRDSLIRRLAKSFEGYGLERNKGYGTEEHRNSLLNKGPSILHRKSFLKKLIE